MTVAQWVKRWSSGVVQAEGSSTGGDIYQYFLAMIFISVLLGSMDFSDKVILCNWPNGSCQQNLKAQFIDFRLNTIDWIWFGMVADGSGTTYELGVSVLICLYYP